MLYIAHLLSRYHTGSLAFGSLILAIVQIIRVILEYMDQKLKGITVQCFLYVFCTVIHYSASDDVPSETIQIPSLLAQCLHYYCPAPQQFKKYFKFTLSSFTCPHVDRSQYYFLPLYKKEMFKDYRKKAFLLLQPATTDL